jgi:Abortive infection alpha
MNPEEIAHSLPVLAHSAAAVGAMVPFTAVVKRMLGPTADELAEMWRDKVRLYRYERQMKCVQKAERLAQDAGFTPQAVPAKILFPLLEGVSMENDDNLHNMWSALLANAASPENGGKVRPGFIATLRQMAPDEAALLAWMQQSTWSPEGETAFTIRMLAKAFDELGFLTQPNENVADSRENLTGGFRLRVCLDSLEAAQLIRSSGSHEGRIYRLTTRGDQFVFSCRAPKPKQA